MNLKLTAAALALAATTGAAVADRQAPFFTTQDGLSADVRQFDQNPYANGRNIFAVYDFASGSLDYFADPALGTPIVFDASLGGLQVLGVEASDITADINWNTGAVFENWASELRLGWEDAGFGTIGVAPFPGSDPANNEGPAVEGTSLTFTGGGFGFVDLSNTDIDMDGVVDDFFMPAAGAAVNGFSTFDDGTGQSAGTVTGGTITFTLVPSPGAAGLLGLAAIRRRR